MFGSDFLIKLGFDVDNKAIKDLKAEIKSLQELADKVKVNLKGKGSKTRRSSSRGNTKVDTNLKKGEASSQGIAENLEKAKQDSIRMRRERHAEMLLMRRSFNDFVHAFGSIAALYATFATIRDSQQVKFNMENAMTQMQVAFKDSADGMVDRFVNDPTLKELGIGRVAATETLSHLAPALHGGKDPRFTEKEAQGISKELLLISKFSGQLGDMPAIARNFGQMATSLEGEDVNQFADRMKGLMPFIYENLVEMGKISEANRASFMKAKEMGQVVSDDFIRAFRTSVQRISKDEKLLARIGGKLNVAWGTLLASIEDARLNFMGEINGKGKTSLSEQLAETYDTLSAFFRRSTRTWKAWGEVLGKVIQGLTWAFLEMEQMYLRFAIFLRDTFNLDEDTAERTAIWITFGAILVPIVALLGKFALKLKRLFNVFGLIGGGATVGATGAGAGFVASITKFGGAVTAFAASIAAWTGIVAVIDSIFNKQDGGFGLARFMGLEDVLPDWMFTGIGSDNEFDKMLKKEAKWKEQVKLNAASKMPWATDIDKSKYREVGKSPRELAMKHGLDYSSRRANSNTNTDNRQITNTYNINEADKKDSRSIVQGISKLQESPSNNFSGVLALNGG